jgi:hippurate hydrolase
MTRLIRSPSTPSPSRRPFARLASAALLVLGAAAPARALDVAAVKPALLAEIDADYPRLDALYKDIHAHPELGFQETRTAARLAAEMRALGFVVTEGVGGTGVVAIYRNGPGPLVLVRTELDALPMRERTGLAYASQAKATWNGRETYVAHSCGHDSHMAIWTGTAKALLSLKSRWRGTLMFVGQPSEETVGGAKAMLADGLYTRFGGKPDYAFALHVGPGPAGEISYRAGAISSTSDALEITFVGRGAHGSMPSISIDPIVMAARFVEDVQTVISREKDPAAFGVVTVGGIQAGTVGNIIPDTAELKGTIRTYDEAVRQRIHDGIRRTAAGVAAISGAPAPKVEIIPGGAAVINDPALTARTATVLKAAFGDHVHEDPKPGTASEDFSEFVNAGVPGTFLGLGGLDPAVIAAAHARGEPVPANHSPNFAPLPEPTIKAGVEAMTLTVMNVMPAGGS